MDCTHGHPVPGAVVPGVLPVAAPGSVAGARAFLALAASTGLVSHVFCGPFLSRLRASAARQPLPFHGGVGGG
jgi:hypothetical protein